MQILNLGVNHHTAPIDIRESVAISPDDLQDSLLDLRNYLKGSHSQLTPEVAILSTCNRMEIYCAANDVSYPSHHLEERAFDWLTAQKRIHSDALKPYIYSAKETDAVKHVFRVSCGMDSMVIGETQILGQMKKAVEFADQAGTLGAYLKPLFNKTFSVAKAVRATTDIGTHSVSMAGASVRLAEKIFGDLKNSKILFIGAGEMIQLCASHFASRRPKEIAISNRTVDRGDAMAKVFAEKGLQTDSFPLQSLPARLHDFDVIVSCTASSLPIIGMGMIKTALKARNSRPIVLIDLAVPRDMEPEIRSLKDAYLYSVDDLGSVVNEGRNIRELSMVDAQTIIDKGVSEFFHTLQKRTLVPIIQSLQTTAERLKEIELEKAVRRIKKGEDPVEVLAIMAQALANKFMHAPINALQNSPNNEIEDFKRILSSIYSPK
ncbi:glutamyl-tRNA reductase [Polynucleobacter sp. AP-Melu-500A-A1]|uniref:glutamyl-tRNA reductase n=1 Tax=Polynucleobacter sp. AP-Melu-500A-A1 TaxID=2576929 RepID=UPI001C0B08B1|nr:glutamyl-tRNA reductase [Polynucleobacter sp. AP-Melu-500A-A1]MBU3630885.1 glutamyl-tRNA reductase [Polynucleobacter sp. AP-Melu-500A-A1]